MNTANTFGGKKIVAAEAATLAAFVGFLVIPQPGRTLALVVMVAGAAAVVLLAVSSLLKRAASRPWAVVAAVSAVGLVGSVFYLNSLADEPAAIPLGGVGALLASLIGLFVSTVWLHATKGPSSRTP